jgi:antitoxin MazE
MAVETVETIEKKKELASPSDIVYNYNVITGGKMLVSVIRIGNSRGVRFPKYVLERFGIKDKMDMEVTEDGILLSPVSDIPRKGWAEAFKQMHENKEDILEGIPDSEDFEWEW